jgi:hypothetical protein
MARAAREARAKAREKSLSETKRAKAEEKKLKAALVQGALAGQVAAGSLPSIEKAAQIASVSVAKARNAAPSDLVQNALLKNGITLDLLDDVGKDGLKANSVKLVYDENVIDSIAIPDHHARHKFWRDYNMMHGRLGSEKESAGGGGLIIIAPELAKVVPGHNVACTCDACIDAWNEKTKHLATQAARQMAIDMEIVEARASAPESLNLTPEDPEDDWEDDADVDGV